MRTLRHSIATLALICLANGTGLVVSTSSILLTLAALAVPSEASQARRSQLWQRATPQAPNGYAPAAVDCPSTRPTIRRATGLSQQEKDWLQKRRPNTLEPMKELLKQLKIDKFDASSYIDNHKNDVSALPNVAIAFSGGGYRAMLNGAGALAAFDSRTSNSTNSGQLGGLLQSATYIAGLSGGNWLVGSIYINNFTSVQSIIDSNSGDFWQFKNSILDGPAKGGVQLLDTVEYWHDLHDTIKAKKNAPGMFNLSITDYWGRALSYQLINAPKGGPQYTFSSIQDDPDFKDANAPMPIVLADVRAPGDTIISLNATNVEFNPFEMGTFDPTIYAFAPTRYLGSNFSAGSIPEHDKCLAGFDNAGFVMGTSSSLFNQIVLRVDGQQGVPDIVKKAVKDILNDLSHREDDIADYTPNPFYQFNNGTNPSANSIRLTLVDGGEDGQNIPLNPLIQPVRHVDVIFAVDSSADTAPPSNSAQNWPNGASLIATYKRSQSSIMNGTAFPTIPDSNTFINLGLNNRPTFFGCSLNKTTSASPLIVYLPNSPYVYNSNTSTFQMSYTNAERDAIIQNGYNVVTMGNGTVDSNWPACVGCAILSRSFERTRTTVPEICQNCFTKYCWNGTIDSREPALYIPEMKLTALGVEGEKKGIISKIEDDTKKVEAKVDDAKTKVENKVDQAKDDVKQDADKVKDKLKSIFR